MTTVFFVRTTESYAVSLVSITRQTSYDYSILRQDYGIIRVLPMDYTKVAEWVTLRQAGLINTSNQTVRAVHSCNSSFSDISCITGVPSPIGDRYDLGVFFLPQGNRGTPLKVAIRFQW